MKKLIISLVLLAGCAATVPLIQHEAAMLNHAATVKELQAQIDSAKPSAETLQKAAEFEKFVAEEWGPMMAQGLTEAIKEDTQLKPLEYTTLDNFTFAALSLNIVSTERTMRAHAFFHKSPFGKWVFMGMRFLEPGAEKL